MKKSVFFWLLFASSIFSYLTPFPATAGLNSWTPVGPTFEGTGGNYRYACSIAFSSQFATNGKMFMGDELGYIYTYGMNSNTWGNISLDTAWLEALAVAPDDTVFVASTNGYRVYRSDDSGNSWVDISRFYQLGGVTFNAHWKFGLSPDFIDDQTLFMAENVGVSRSTDRGDNWVLKSTGLPGGSMVDIVLSPAYHYPSSEPIFVGGYGGLFYSTDDGESWQVMQGDLPPNAVSSLAISPGFTEDHTLLAGVDGLGFYKSTDGGATWSRINVNLTYSLKIVLSPDYLNDGTIFVRGGYGNTTYLMASTNGGTSWTTLENAPYDPRVISFSPNFAQDKTVYIGVEGPTAEIPSALYSYTFGPSNQAPVLNPIGNLSVQEGQPLEVTVSATDTDNNNLTYSVSNLPLGANFDPTTGHFSWIPAFNQAGSYNVLFAVTDDGTPPMATTEDITISVGNVNRPPEINVNPQYQAYEEELLSFSVDVADPDGDSLNLSVGNLPFGATFDTNTGTFTWTPSYDQQGNHYVTFSASDADLTVSEEVLITVNDVNRPPVLTPIGNKTINEGQVLEFVVSATDPDGNPLVFSAENLPEGALFNPVSQMFHWVPSYDQEGTYDNVEFTVVDTPDGNSSLELDSELITISVGGTNRAPLFVSVGTQIVNENQTLAFSVSANDPDGDDIVYTHNELPIGSVFNEGELTWTPNNSQSGSYLLKFFATDNGAPAMSSELDVVVNVGDIFTPCELSDQIINAIETEGLSKTVENSYMANVKKVCPFVEKGKFTPAINQLDAFNKKVEQDMIHGLISQEYGNNLIEMSNYLIGNLQN